MVDKIRKLLGRGVDWEGATLIPYGLGYTIVLKGNRARVYDKDKKLIMKSPEQPYRGMALQYVVSRLERLAEEREDN